MRPLHKEAVRNPEARSPDGHAGLWFDKFCNQWSPSNGTWTMGSDKSDADNPKLSWINQFTDGPIGTGKQIDEYALRLARLVEERKGRWFVFKTSSRFVTGLGRSHPVENGFAWHATLGTPYLPGSSIKGLVHAWAKLDAYPPPSCKDLESLLGKIDAAGRIGFLDAVPVKAVRLEADVMTPHYGGWTREDPPGDWRSPTPIPFLTTAADTPFLFGIIPSRVAPERDPEVDLDAVGDWLREALATVGGGAKTAIGYGRFELDEPATDALRQGLRDRERKIEADVRQARAVREREARIARMSPIEREIEELVESRPNKTESAVIFIIRQVQRDRWAGGAKIAVARWLEGRMKREKIWGERTRRKNPAKDKDHQRTKLVQSWL